MLEIDSSQFEKEIEIQSPAEQQAAGILEHFEQYASGAEEAFTPRYFVLGVYPEMQDTRAALLRQLGCGQVQPTGDEPEVVCVKNGKVLVRKTRYLDEVPYAEHIWAQPADAPFVLSYKS